MSSRTYTRDGGVPVVEGNELIDEIKKSRDLALGVVSHHLIGSPLSGDRRVLAHLAVDKALHVGLQGTIGNGLVIGGVSGVELEVVTSHRVIGVMANRVVVLVRVVPLTTASVIDKLGVPERTVVDHILQISLDAIGT